MGGFLPYRNILFLCSLTYQSFCFWLLGFVLQLEVLSCSEIMKEIIFPSSGSFMT